MVPSAGAVRSVAGDCGNFIRTVVCLKGHVCSKGVSGLRDDGSPFFGSVVAASSNQKALPFRAARFSK